MWHFLIRATTEVGASAWHLQGDKLPWPLFSFSPALSRPLRFSVILRPAAHSPTHAQMRNTALDVGMIMSAESTGLSSRSSCRSSSITVIKVTHRDLMMDRRKTTQSTGWCKTTYAMFTVCVSALIAVFWGGGMCITEENCSFFFLLLMA